MKFTDRIRKHYALMQIKKRNGLDQNATFKDVDEISHNAYFIRVIDNPKLFVHYDTDQYVVRNTAIMACVFTWEAGNNFVRSVERIVFEGKEYEGLEMIQIKEALKGYEQEELRNPILDHILYKK